MTHWGLREKADSKEHRALDHVTFDVKKGETVGIIGTNGSGKSTILKIITGVLSPTSGEVEIDGRISALLELGAGFNMEYTGIGKRISQRHDDGILQGGDGCKAGRYSEICGYRRNL